MESVNNNKSLYINNLLPFMNREYLNKILNKFKEIKEIKVENNPLGLPDYAFIVFESAKLVDNFLKNSNDKNLDETITTPFFFEEEKKPRKNFSLEEFHEPIKFSCEYDNMINTVYEKTNKEPGLILRDKEIISRQDKVIGYLIKKLGSNIIKGKSVMNISLPVTIFDKRTLHDVFAYEMSFASFYLNRAYYSNDVNVKLNWIITFLMSQLYLSPLQYKPFSPVLGETLECKVGDLDLYLEQTSSKPLVCNFYGVAPNYKIHGHYSTNASTGANSVKACKQGKFLIELKDGNSYELLFPQVHIKGTTVGKRLFNFKKMCAVIDRQNNLSAIIKLNPDEKGFFTSIFSSKQKSSPDTFKGEVITYSDFVYQEFQNYTKKKGAKEICEIKGEWTNHLIIHEKEYWRIKDYPLLPLIRGKNSLPSDSHLRKDLMALLENDEANAQKLKEEIEELQRNDRKLREEFHKKMKKEEK